jgi:DNA-binding response OmpR family regulator
MGQPSPLGGKKVLIVEDDFLIAQDQGALLRTAGCFVCGMVGTSSAALKFLGNERPDGVLLDVNLRDRDASPVARALASRGVPFMLVTAYERLQLPAALRGWPCLSKPYSAESLVAMAERTFTA